ncbi:NAD(P)/FAD-dependent oxidoreductase [Dysgonomonas macrotermitis]|uniref:Geranylgeranyl reductase family n=1 Tax=Dysgonomonas macrotermitis TaxID=1346286 RepID=A0A1M4SVE5_9BACT|nr:FAD-dependent monooxygenase [Dysgonomonas macrotermitis]SHE36185.1 geranylgeranyl reductase family [Dysgonomonas macrotermitis]
MNTETKHFETIIIGGGPAGTTCGYMLTQKGNECLIIERSTFPRDKVCGGGLTPKCYRLIDKIFDNLTYDYKPVKTLEVNLGKKRSRKFPLSDEIRVVCRKDFDNTLLDAYKRAGGQILHGRATGIEEQDGKIFVTLADGSRLSCNKLIGADGANSIVRKYLQPKNNRKMLLLEKTITDKSFDHIKLFFDYHLDKGYMYMFPNPEGCVIGYGDTETNREEFSRRITTSHLPNTEKQKGAYLPIFDNIEYRMHDQIILIGDAGGFVDSISGEGIFYAIQTGAFAAQSVSEGKSYKDLCIGITNRIRKINMLSEYFYNKLVHVPVVYFCTTDFMYDRIRRKIDEYLAR